MEQAFRYRFYPTPEQESLLRRTIGCKRLVYNRALAARTEAWYKRQEKVEYIQTSSMLTQWKKQEDLQFLNDVSCVPLQQGLRHLQKAFANFFAGRAKYPNFKKKHNGGSAEFTRSAFKWKDEQVFLAKCVEALPIRWSRPLPDGCIPSTITVKLDARGRWYVSLLVGNPNIQTFPICTKSVGLDVGISSLLTTNDGDKITTNSAALWINYRVFSGLYYQQLSLALIIPLTLAFTETISKPHTDCFLNFWTSLVRLKFNWEHPNCLLLYWVEYITELYTQ